MGSAVDLGRERWCPSSLGLPSQRTRTGAGFKRQTWSLSSGCRKSRPGCQQASSLGQGPPSLWPAPGAPGVLGWWLHRQSLPLSPSQISLLCPGRTWVFGFRSPAHPRRQPRMVSSGDPLPGLQGYLLQIRHPLRFRIDPSLGVTVPLSTWGQERCTRHWD